MTSFVYFRVSSWFRIVKTATTKSHETTRRKTLVFLLVTSLGITACGASGKGDAEQLAKDPTATAELNRINTLLASNRPVTRIDIESLNRLHAAYPNANNVRQLLQGALIKRQDWAAAEKIIVERPSVELTNADRINLAKIYIKQGKFGEAADVLKAITPSANERVEVTGLLGTAQFHSGELEAAEKTLAPIQPDLVASGRADELALLGTIYSRRGDHAKAIAVLEQAIAVSPENVSVNNAISRAYAASGDTDNAESSRAKLQTITDKIAASEKRKSRLVPLFYQLEDAYAANDFDKVIALVQQIEPEADDATKPALYQYLAMAYRAQGREADAQRALADAAKLTKK